jgi:predicted flap endonuclease-1-like 5' DNA nuclease
MIMTVVLLRELRGMTPGLEGSLQLLGIYDAGLLLEAARTRADREALAKRVGIQPHTILELAQRAELSRICGATGTYSDMLEEAGVTTVTELAARHPSRLRDELVAASSRLGLAVRVPSLDQIEFWHARAWDQPRGLE